MLQVKVNEKYNFDVDQNGKGLLINGDKITADLQQLNASAYHVINNLQSYNVEVVNFNVADKTAEIKVNNNTYNVTAKDQFDILLDKLGLSSLNAAKVSEIKAPMPGMVLKVFVNEGMEIKKGDNLFVLEAMKMENIIKAPADVTVKNVKIKPGDKVEKGQVLMMF
ncbi:acetyl-CoA carboxylase biotin carboxyl carrier protein subunit [Mucilaginibacter flavidus]|uniref:acetyl-CoA carboxylase biotin carboxyl carrier protein subunit n=1 Tax=Mucilaginibacter flavidus TaxID=2949309 RepID=UPI0020935797|nr:acetyl-CoA carboxylase biotin carboxyl carrier protein subunit [Mucilaginibacter flavidus]MCO5946198.1 acetyl-CoA carboxylase biotin carboxyl carrier protein subunit [Mucilaginibacter flavidus]